MDNEIIRQYKNKKLIASILFLIIGMSMLTFSIIATFLCNKYEILGYFYCMSPFCFLSFSFIIVGISKKHVKEYQDLSKSELEENIYLTKKSIKRSFIPLVIEVIICIFLSINGYHSFASGSVYGMEAFKYWFELMCVLYSPINVIVAMLFERSLKKYIELKLVFNYLSNDNLSKLFPGK